MSDWSGCTPACRWAYPARPSPRMNRSQSHWRVRRGSVGQQGPSPGCRLRDRAAWDVLRKLSGPKHGRPNMPLMSCHCGQLRSHSLATGAHHKHGLTLLGRYHSNRRDEIGVVRDDHGGGERLLPRIVDQMYGQVYVRPLLLHRMDFGHYGIWMRPRPFSPLLRTLGGRAICADRQLLGCWPRNGVSACGHDDRVGSADPTPRDRKVGQRPPNGLGEKTPPDDFDLGQGRKGAQVGLLPSWCAGIGNPIRGR